jgi:hypothetical protein
MPSKKSRFAIGGKKFISCDCIAGFFTGGGNIPCDVVPSKF